jgi:DNA-binding transcriptional LysR family regulator
MVCGYILDNEEDCLHMNYNEEVELSDIKAFIAVIESGTFTKAADYLKVTRGHISKQIKALELALGVRLITRTTRSLELTEIGKTFYDQANSSLTLLDNAVSSTINEAQEIKGTIRVNSVGGIIGEDVLAPIIAKFGVKYPEVDLELDFSSHRSNLVGDKFDLIIRMGKLEDSNFMAKKIADIKISTLASPDYINKTKKLKHPKDLKALNCLTGSVKKWNFINIKTRTKSEVIVTGNFNCPSGRALLNAAKNHLGIVRLPTMYCAEELKSGELVETLDQWEVESVPISILYYSNKLQTLKTKLLIDFIADEF